MPARQRGSRAKRAKSGTWYGRYYDENNKRRSVSGFPTKSAYDEWMAAKLAEVEALRRGDRIRRGPRIETVDQLLDLFEERHGPSVEENTAETLKYNLKHARRAFGECHPDELTRLDLEEWREQLSPGSRQAVFKAFRQALTWGKNHELIARNATDGIKNPGRSRHERKPIYPFESWDELYAISAELDPCRAAIPIFGVGMGLRPEEWIALEWADIDREAGLVRVARVFTRGRLKHYGKTSDSLRTVPMRDEVIDALDAQPRRIDTSLVFPADQGGYIHLSQFRPREWYPALRAAGIDRRWPYTMRHTFATWAIEDGVHLQHLAHIMGTSVGEIERTYARWLPRTDDQIKAIFDANDAKRWRSGSADQAARPDS